jgi:multidrug efflux system membrane fusion protein
VVTTGFANLAEGAKVSVGNSDEAPTPDLAPRKRQSKGGQGGGGPGGGGKKSQ